MSSASARNSPQVPQVTGDTQYNVRNAALRGASSAFSKPPVKPKPQVNTYTGGSNGALLAATKVGTGTPRNATPSGATTPLRRDWTGGSTRSTARPYASPMQSLSKSSSSSTLAVPEESLFELVPSPSNIAAKLAAARYSPMKPLPHATNTPIMSEREANERDVLPAPGSVGNVLARLDSRQQNISKVKRTGEARTDPIVQKERADVDDKSTDDTSIAPTTSLVNLFEQSRPVLQNTPPLVRAPKPQRAIKLPPEPKDGEPLARQRTKTPPPVKPKPKPLSEPPQFTDGALEISPANFKTLRKDTFGTPPATRKAELAPIETANLRPKLPPKEIAHSRPKSEDISRSNPFHKRRMSSSLSHHEDPSSPSSFVSACETQEDKPKPSLPPPRRSVKPKKESTQAQRPKTATTPTLTPYLHPQSKPTSPLPSPERFSRPRRASVSGTSTPTGTVYHSNYQRESVKAIAKHMTGESLSSAIMGAALASSRNVSPARPSSSHFSPAPALTATPPLPIRKHHFGHSPFGRSPSPPKPKPQPTGKLRTTMRKDHSSSSDEESEKYKRKGTRIMGMGRKHPNKHHEGTRKRWRDQVTERERKRYEGVWAANKGLFVPSPPSSRPSSRSPHLEEDSAHDVMNIVIKEIWSRSRLPEHVLEEVWDLVDSRGMGRLKREEFVVGMWLIDQRLKGRKLPIKVSESVWGSVRGATGLKVKVGDRHSKSHVKKTLPLP
ncbi:Increased rDNA silencing protein [Kalmusia sp. IMI 367209]|nr:Increased rDNA silencing protein [Kalmusia sp. IMI 367209]